ncbi:hypothetical protein DL546_003550 [Coniochaeta pulveracea]|uniref:Anhydro-N-acetylmuramic acid kinase n=1 Tax=Coniochaeta pulveracea TaxID=177199 RepID=A0A420Y7M2_9PEZI|nr:hypothetical protein DL546_003550 [Coniochaeta pulveracea]
MLVNITVSGFPLLKLSPTVLSAVSRASRHPRVAPRAYIMPSAVNQSWGSPLSLKVIGHNAGTSMDGVDLVHVHFTQDSPVAPLNMQLLHYGEYPMPQKVKKRVMKLIKENKTTPEEMAIVNIELGQVIADAVKSFAKDQGFDLEREVDLIGGQGQTIWHLPLPELFEGDQMRAHLDMAEIAIIAADTSITSLGNFRVSDMALGRQGCPLFAALDSLLLNHPTLNRAVQNIGGIANFSILPKGKVEGCYDFDTGPGNVFIDAAVRYFTDGQQEYDKDGAMGAKGTVDQAIVDEILAGPYFVHDIPKTTGRETFGDRMAEDICDKMLASKWPPRSLYFLVVQTANFIRQRERPPRIALQPSPASPPSLLPMRTNDGVRKTASTRSTWEEGDPTIRTLSTTSNNACPRPASHMSTRPASQSAPRKHWALLFSPTSVSSAGP